MAAFILFVVVDGLLGLGSSPPNWRYHSPVVDITNMSQENSLKILSVKSSNYIMDKWH